MIIYGAGMSGLLAAQMLRRMDPVIHEAAPSLPNNHAALLRFRSDIVSRETGIPFKKVWVQKAVLGLDGRLTTKPTIREQNLYSLKVSGTVVPRSIGNLDPGERYIAPENFIEQLAKGLDIKYNSALEAVKHFDKMLPTISTIPMNILMDIAEWSEKPEFKYTQISTITAKIDLHSDVYQTFYHIDPTAKLYRASITGDQLILEMIGGLTENEIQEAEGICKGVLGVFIDSSVNVKDIKTKTQKYGKLVNSTGRSGKEFMMAMTDLYGIYSLGRFATWRQILMDDVAKDIRHIENMIQSRDSYSRRRLYDLR